MAGVRGKVITVQGILDPEDLGQTLTHEHLYIKVPSFYTPPKDKRDEKRISVSFEMQNLGWIRQNPYAHLPNLTLEDEYDAIKDELLFFKENGGKTIVENTTVGIFPDLTYLKKLANNTGVNIICGTGFYVDGAQTESVRALNQEQMAEKMRHDIIEGVDGIRCGIIGEVGTTWPITEFERRSLRSSAAVQEELGCPIIIHPGRNHEAPSEIMRILLEAGGKAEHTVMSHLDRTIFDITEVLEFAKVGCYLEYDLFGIEVSHYQLNEAIDMPSDAERIKFIKALLDEGYEDRIVLGHDIHTRHRLMKYGGHGYSHILLNVVPKMLKREISQTQVDKMLQKNPQLWLQFTK